MKHKHNGFTGQAEDTEKRQENAVSLLNKAGVRGRRFGLYVC